MTSNKMYKIKAVKMINKKTLTSAILVTILFATFVVLFSQPTTAVTTQVSIQWNYIHCEETHDWGNGEFYLYMRWKNGGDYNYYEFDDVSLGEDENDFPNQWHGYRADYPGTIDFQLWEKDPGADDLIIDWRSTTIPGGSTFSYEYESPPGGCYFKIYIYNLP
ncbi:MAG: hypothetical protein ACTSO3_15920 [Candidatus Heimdallarchaeaceae archaeon]